MAEKQTPMEGLRRNLAEGGRLHNCDLTPLTAHDETLLRNLTSSYTRALQDNISSRFKNNLPILSAFKIFETVAVPPKSDQSFSKYANRDKDPCRISVSAGGWRIKGPEDRRIDL